MARNDETEHDDSSEEGALAPSDRGRARRKKVLVIVLMIIVVEVASFALYKVFFGTKSDPVAERQLAEQVREREQQARKTVLRGQWIARNIPDLPPVSVKTMAVAAQGNGKRSLGREQETEMDEDSGKPESERSGSSSEEDSIERTTDGDIIFSTGETRWLGPRGEGEGDGVVVIDRLRVGVDLFGNRVIRGRVANQGHQSLAHVEVTVEFTEPGGTILQSRRVNPLVISGGLFGDRVQTLKPGGSRIFQVDATDLPTSWSGSVATRVEIHHFVP
ncbi:MAG: hypothetical protein HQL76_02670 [Magnetococcales bacterium]|nr:hypothetical protein [Magnetococcales bacterium]